MSENKNVNNNDNAQNEQPEAELQDLISTVIALKKSKAKSADNSGAPDVKFSPREEKKSSDAAPKQTSEKKPSSDGKKKSSAKSGKGSKKNAKGFRSWPKKKKIGFVCGCIFIFLCLLLLLIVVLFHNYFSLLGGKWRGSTTSEKPTYSDVDSTRSDTIDAKTEDEKLKEQLRKSATNIMSDSDVYNVLLIGEDLRDTEGESRGNTDVMMLISINQRLKTITMTSFMRDIYVYIPDWEYSNRLNAAYWHGGPESLENTLEQYFGVTIDRYAIVNFNQFITIVDTLGGLTLDVTDAEVQAMVDPQNEQNMYLNQPFGTDILTKGGTGLKLNGNQALAFARIRKGVGDDFGRTKRQRTVIAEMINKAKNMSLTQLNDLVHEIFPNIYTDVEEGEAASLLLNAFDYMKYDIQQVQVPADGTFTDEIIDGMDILSIDFDANAKIVQDTIYGSSTVDDSSEDDISSQESVPADANANGYYDEWGNWVPYNNGYYDEWGNWISY